MVLLAIGWKLSNLIRLPEIFHVFYVNVALQKWICCFISWKNLVGNFKTWISKNVHWSLERTPSYSNLQIVFWVSMCFVTIRIFWLQWEFSDCNENILIAIQIFWLQWEYFYCNKNIFQAMIAIKIFLFQ